jgi:peroxiredoxin
MKIRQVSLIIAVAIVLLGAGLWFAKFRAVNAPEVQFKTLTGEQFTTSQMRGKVMLVNFWATSCVTCMAEMPKMIDTYNRFHEQGFEMVAVAMDYDPPNFVLSYTEQKKLPFKVALDIDSVVARGFGNVRLTPTTFVIDKRGHVIREYLGEPDFKQLHALLAEQLKEPA